ncbi:MAG: thiol-disulfide oxidoreductase DCC family protein [Pyrinomonadaceae bacterium]
MASIVLFDGVCNFCNDAVNFIIRRDVAGEFQFTPLQSEKGGEIRARFGIPDDLNSVVLIQNEKVYLRSTAALRIAKTLGGFWQLVYALIILPAGLRDYLYELFADNRYRLFGKRDACMMPTPEIRERFL